MKKPRNKSAKVKLNKKMQAKKAKKKKKQRQENLELEHLKRTDIEAYREAIKSDYDVFMEDEDDDEEEYDD